MRLAKQFSGVLQDLDSSEVSDDDIHVLVFIAGYSGRKLRQTVTCTACIDVFLSPDDMTCDVNTNELFYIQALDRGGLKWPRQILVDIVTLIYCLFERLLSSDYEKQFIEASNHKQLAVFLSLELLQSKSDFNCVCEAGQDTKQNLFKLCARKMANIFLNNYSKRLNDAATKSKGHKDKKTRKLATLGH